jgi:periplasmic protein CpxP/Spy
MKRSTKILAAAAIAAASLGAVGLSVAHPGGMGWGPGYGAMGGGPGHGGMWGGMGGWTSASEASTVVGSRLAAVKAELKITPAQQAAWTAFEDQTQQQVASMQALRQQMQERMHGATPGSSAEFAALRDGMFKLRQANAEAHAKVVKDLYAELTPEQRAVADRALYGPAFGGGYGRGQGPGDGARFGPGCGF